MTAPDFELSVGLRARILQPHALPDAQMGPEGAVKLVRKQRRRGLPVVLEPGARYADVVVVKRIIGSRR
jgi:hypothetical protein